MVNLIFFHKHYPNAQIKKNGYQEVATRRDALITDPNYHTVLKT